MASDSIRLQLAVTEAVGRGTGTACTRLLNLEAGTVMRPRQSCRLLVLLIAMLCSGIVYPVATGAVDLEAVTERAVWHAMPVVRVWFSWNEFSVGLGNSLAGYWYGRAVCQLLGLPFDIGAAPIEQTGFLAALPLEVAAPAGGPLVTTPEQLADFKEMLDCVAGTQHGIYAPTDLQAGAIVAAELPNFHISIFPKFAATCSTWYRKFKIRQRNRCRQPTAGSRQVPA